MINHKTRSYDMQIGRWMQPDPLMQHFSPYLAMSNNPTLFTDPTGLWDGQDDPPRTFHIPITSRTIGPDGLQIIGIREATIFANKRTIYPNSLSTNHSGGGDGGGFMDEVRVPDNFGTKYNITYAQSVLDYMKRVDINNANHRAFNQTNNMMERRAKYSKHEINLTNNFMYPGVKIYLNNQRKQGYFNPITKTINLPGWIQNDPAKMRDYIRHEYGHYLQLQKYGLIDFLFIVTPVSIFSANDPNHMYIWSEIEANRLANDYFQSRYPNSFGTFFDKDLYRLK